MPARDQHVAAVRAGRHHGAAQPRVPGRPDVADRARVGLHALVADQLQHELVLAVAQAVDGLGVGRIVVGALGQLDAAGLEERPGAVGAGLAVHVRVVVLDRVERDELLARPLGPLAQVVVEHLLPGRGVDLGRLGEHAIEVEEAAAHAVRETKHGIKRTGPVLPAVDP